jgi:vacuolar-type H+-ATPase subunit I/STV1
MCQFNYVTIKGYKTLITKKSPSFLKGFNFFISYFGLVKEPKEILLEYFVKASQDIKKIDETLAEIKKQLDEISQRNDSTEIQEKNQSYATIKNIMKMQKTKFCHL